MRISSITKNAGKACNNRLYRHIRTFKKIVKNYFVISAKLDEFMEHHDDEVEDQDEQILGILKYLTEWLVNHILYVDCQIPKG